jgi:hypothetical protein
VIFAGILHGYASVYAWFGLAEIFFMSACTSDLVMRSGVNCAGCNHTPEKKGSSDFLKPQNFFKANQDP